MAQQRWRNWYRMPDVTIDRRRVTCPQCGKSETKEPHEVFCNHHCGDDGKGFVSKQEAEYYAPNLYVTSQGSPWCEWLGAFPEGKRP